jgi:3-hydroxyisobutyrate dehydrogenase-like beta-hydroxyacid dehydrogenase
LGADPLNVEEDEEVSNDRTVGFVGLGNLGQAMALRLLDREWDVRVLDPKAARVEPVVKAGAEQTDAAGLAQAKFICFAVPDDTAIRAVLESGLADALTSEHTVVVHSTILPQHAEALAASIASTGARYLDAPVSGGSERARRGELTAFTGGDPGVLEATRPLIDDLANGVFPLGGIGAGSATKLANQLVMFSALAGLHEALQLTGSAGVDTTAALEALGTGTADTWVGRNWGFFDRVAADYDEAEVPVRERPWSKDVWEILAAAREAQIELPFAGLLSQSIARTIEAHSAEAKKGRDA